MVLATPATLVALLRTVAYSWRQEALARNAVAVHSLARELYGRLSTLGEHVGKLGRSLGGAVTAYNKAVGSLESRVLVSARKLAEMGVSDDELAGAAPRSRWPRASPRRPSCSTTVRSGSVSGSRGGLHVAAQLLRQREGQPLLGGGELGHLAEAALGQVREHLHDQVVGHAGAGA